MKDFHFDFLVFLIVLLGEVTLITLKLTNIVNWSWWIITVPLWVGIGIFLGALLASELEW